MKRLKFSGNLPDLIISGKKTSTWRINDEKNIKVGDILSLCDLEGVEFRKGVANRVKETTFSELTEEDKRGHERFESDEEMYANFSKYYKIEVTPETKVKMIRFKLI